MRDDVFNLSTFRRLTEPARVSLPGPPVGTPRTTTGKPPLSFAAALAKANSQRKATQPPKPYVSPMKRTHAESPNAQKPATTRPATSPSLTAYSSLSRPSTSSSTSLGSSKPSKPVTPLPAPDAVQQPPDLSTTALPLNAYPHPNGDNGRGMHWIPTTRQSPATVDKFVAEAQRMGVKWVTFLNDGASIGQNDYLVNKLTQAGIEPVMRIYSPAVEPLHGDIEGMVRHYVGLGVHYFQPFNEPNLKIEQRDGTVSVDRYLDAWIPAAKAIARGGGLPGFGALAPGGDVNDIDFLRSALDGLRARGEMQTLDRAWLSMHNYTHNHALEERADTDGFFKFRAYHSILSSALGRDIPIIGTEGGTFVGEHEDTTLPAIDQATAVSMTRQAYQYMRDQREPWNFAYSFWTIANEAGGGADASFRAHALFGADGAASPIVGVLRTMA